MTLFQYKKARVVLVLPSHSLVLAERMSVLTNSYVTYSNDILCLEKHYLFKKSQLFRVNPGIISCCQLWELSEGEIICRHTFKIKKLFCFFKKHKSVTGQKIILKRWILCFYNKEWLRKVLRCFHFLSERRYVFEIINCQWLRGTIKMNGAYE